MKFTVTDNFYETIVEPYCTESKKNIITSYKKKSQKNYRLLQNLLL